MLPKGGNINVFGQKLKQNFYIVKILNSAKTYDLGLIY